MRVGLLECDDVVGRFPGIDGGYREMFAALLPEAEFRYYQAHGGALPASPTECDAWLCTGSKYSVYDPDPWIANLAAFIRGVSGKRPFVGICFGHQMLAHAMGGEVAKAGQGWGVGVLPVEMLRQEPWMEPRRSQIRIQHMHQDQVQKLPPDSVLLGRSPHCEVGMFRVGRSMLGIEGHPEFTAAFGGALIRARREKIGAPRAQEALESLAGPADGPVVGRWIARYIETT
jgi:GMP synthase-like glutamine amidotransferase